MTVTMRSVTSSWPIAIGSTTRVAARPATLPDGSGAIAPGQYAIAAGRTLGIDPIRILGRGRHAKVVLARHLAMVCARRGGHSLVDVADAFDRNHTTVMYAERTVRDRARCDPTIDWLLDTITGLANTGRQAPRAAPAPAPAARPRKATPPAPTPAATAPAPRPRSTSPAVPAVRGGVDEVLGVYADRCVVLAVCSGARTLVDRRRDGSDERVIERFGAGSKREQITAIARDYLAQARRHGPRVARSAA